jgi:uncharacterized membrane protein YhaH (DUF805 family)
MLKKYFLFKGRAQRQEFWAVMLSSCVLGFLLGSIGLIFFSTANLIEAALLCNVFLVVILSWLNLATAARRCRDAGISPLWIISYIIPYLGVIALIVFGTIRSKDVEESTSTVTS